MSKKRRMTDIINRLERLVIIMESHAGDSMTTSEMQTVLTDQQARIDALTRANRDLEQQLTHLRAELTEVEAINHKLTGGTR